MVRQAHTYLVGAVSGATLIAVAIAAFVLLVSAQVFAEWPIAGLGDSKETAVHEGQPVGGTDGAADAASAAAAAPATAGAGARTADQGAGAAAAAAEVRGGATTEGDSSVEAVPGDQGGSGPAPSNPGTSDPGASSPAPAGSGGGSAGGGSSSSGGGGGGSSTSTTPSQGLTEGVNNTVTSVDQTVTGGALEATGVTAVTEGVVNGVAGPESVVGKTVDGVADTVGGLLGQKP